MSDVQGDERPPGRPTDGARPRLCRPGKPLCHFVIGRDGTRDEVVAKFRAWIAQQPALLAALDELRGKHLVYWCAPERCHAKVLLELANR